MLVRLKNIAIAGVEKSTTIISKNNTTSNNTLNLNVSTLTREKAEQVFECLYDSNVLIGGHKALAKFVKMNLLGDNEYVSTDISRGISKYNDNGTIKRDVNCQHVVGVIHKPATNAAYREYKNLMADYTNDGNDIDATEAAQLRLEMAMKSFLETKRLDESTTFPRELGSLTVN